MKIIIVDIDGTVANNAHREQYWDTTRENLVEYYQHAINDLPIPHIIEWVNELWRQGYHIHILTARDGTAEPYTKPWLDKHGVLHHRLTLGDRTDRRRGYLIKRDILSKMDLSEILFCLEDNPKVIEMMVELGLCVYDVVNKQWVNLPETGEPVSVPLMPL